MICRLYKGKSKYWNAYSPGPPNCYPPIYTTTIINSSPPGGGEAHKGWFKEKTRVRVRAYDEAGLTQREIVRKLQEERGISIN